MVGLFKKFEVKNKNKTVLTKSVLIQECHQTTSETFHFTDSGRVFSIQFSLLCPEERT